MLEIAKITYRAFGKVSSKDIAIPNQRYLFGDYENLKKVCIGDCVCSDYVILGIDFRKLEVLE